MINLLLSFFQFRKNYEQKEKEVPIGEWGGNLGRDYEYIYKWGAKNLRNAMRDCDNVENNWDLIVDKCVEELSDNYGYNFIDFGQKKNYFNKMWKVK